VIGTISKVFQREGNTKPGAVVFSDGKKLTTFSDALIATALNGVGQIAEYTIEINEKNGKKYENLGSITLKGAAPAPAQSYNAPSESKGVDLGGAVVASAVKDLTAAVRELTSLLARQPRPAVVPSAGQPGGTVPVTTAVPEQPAEDPIDAAQAKLADHIGSVDAAEAMFASLKVKHAKGPAKLAKAVEELLKAHGVQ
jgi:hypothetical protein